ncbi:hypothetical protein EON65_56790, partial [archaeon]
MPPKAVVKPAGGAGAGGGAGEGNCSISITLTHSGLPPSPSPSTTGTEEPLPPKEGYRVRIFSKCASCATTSPIFGDRDVLAWEIAE